MNIPESPLDDPRNATHAWARYKRAMKAMVWLTLVIVLAIMGLMFWQNGFVSISFYVATALGFGGMIMLTAALMGLVFLSSGTGHDEAIVDPLEDERNR